MSTSARSDYSNNSSSNLVPFSLSRVNLQVNGIAFLGETVKLSELALTVPSLWRPQLLPRDLNVNDAGGKPKVVLPLKR